MAADIVTRSDAAIQAKPAAFGILTFLYSFAPGGVERIAARLHGAWQAGGAEPRIVLADAGQPPPVPLDRVTQAGASPHRHGFPRFVALVLGTRAQVLAQRPDILFCAGNTYSAVAVVLRLLLGRRCPPIVAKISNCLVRRDMPRPVRLCYHLWLRIQGRYIDHFVGMAPAMQAEIAAYVGVPQTRISIVEDPAVSQACLTRLAAARDAGRTARAGRHYLAIGRLAPQKNFGLLLDAFARISGAGDTLTILGDGPERAALERRAGERGIAGRLHMPGHLDLLDPWLATADALVVSSDYEGVPAVIVEALATGLPIVATNCCVSMAGLLGDGALGRLVPVGDAAALAEAMAAACPAPRRPEPAHVVQARRAAAARFTLDHASAAYLELMRTLAAGHAAKAPARDGARGAPVPSRST